MGALTFYRIKPRFTNPDDIIDNRQDPQLIYSPVTVDENVIAHLYIKRVVRAKPAWLAYFGRSIALPRRSLKTASIAAVLLIKVDDEFYAVVFGYGSSLLAQGVVEDRFGLRATLNAVEPSSLRSVDHKRLEATSRHTREQLSRTGGLDQFSLDTNRDLLRGVTGKPTDDQYGTRLSGSDQLTVTANIPLASLPARLKAYGKLSSGEEYKKTFPWVDNIAYVKNPALITRLEAELAKQLVTGTDTVWLAPPEIIEWDKTLGFAYRSRKTALVYPDLALEDYFDECGAADQLAGGQRLLHDRIYLLRSDTEGHRRSWSVQKCLVAEIDYKGERYVLNEGLWYRIEPSYVAALDAFVNAIPTTKIDLPDYNDTSEGAYNRRAWQRDKSHLALLDLDFIQYPKRGRVEVCDLYAKDKIFVHVKRLSGSSTLSHLFNQGAVSAELLRDEPGFREQFLAKIPTLQWGKAKDPITPSDFEVSYAIVQKSKKALNLPFFSKISLRTATQHIRQLGFRVSMIGIPTA